MTFECNSATCDRNQATKRAFGLGRANNPGAILLSPLPRMLGNKIGDLNTKSCRNLVQRLQRGDWPLRPPTR